MNELEKEFRDHLRSDAEHQIQLATTLKGLEVVANNQQKLMEICVTDIKDIRVKQTEFDKFKVKTVAYATIAVFLLINAEMAIQALVFN